MTWQVKAAVDNYCNNCHQMDMKKTHLVSLWWAGNPQNSKKQIAYFHTKK